MLLDSRAWELDQLARTILEVFVCGLKVKEIFVLSIMWSTTLESMTQLDDEEMSHLVELPDSKIAVIRVNFPDGEMVIVLIAATCVDYALLDLFSSFLQ